MNTAPSTAAIDAACDAYSASSLNPESNGMEEDMAAALHAAFAIHLAELEAEAVAKFAPLIDELAIHASRGHGPLTRGHENRLAGALGRPAPEPARP